jgi:hypothetical protein
MRDRIRGAAAVVAVLVACVLVLPELAAGPQAGDSATLPARFAGPSPLMASVSDAPPGPAIALIRQKFLFFNRDEVVVVGVDGRTYRRLDLADRRGAPAERDAWVPGDALLAPDGSAAAVADPVRMRDRIEVVDLRTGRITAYRLDQPAAVRLMDWSPDGRWLALDLTRGGGQPAVLDLRTGALRHFDRLPELAWSGASFAPDSTRLALLTTRALPTGDRYVPTLVVIIVDLAGTELRVLPDRDHLFPDLARAAWSPDGRWLVVPKSSATGWSLVFLDATGRQAPVPAPVPQTGDMVSWRSPATMLVATASELVEVPVYGGASRPVSRLPAEVSGRQHHLQLADGLVGTARARDAGGPRRGPWPWWWRLTLSGVIVLLVLSVLLIVALGSRPARRVTAGRR